MPGGRYRQNHRGGSSLAQGRWAEGAAQAAQEAGHFLPAQGSQALGQGKAWKPKGTEAVFGSSRELGSGQSPKQVEGLSSGGAFQAPCFFCLLVGKPAQASPIFASGEQLGIIFRRSSDWEGGGAQPPDLQASAGLSSEALSSEAARMA